MNRKTAACWMVLSLVSLTSLAQDAVWTNVSSTSVITGLWHTAENWLPNALPVAGQDVRLTNTVNSYAVDVNSPVTIYETSGTAQTLYMANSVGNTVTLNVHDDITGSAGTALADNTKRVTLNLGSRGVVTIAAGKSMRFVAPAEASQTSLMYGTLDIFGTAYWHHPADGDGLYQTKITVRNGGLLSTLGQSSTDSLNLGAYSRVVIEAGGMWTYSTDDARELRMAELQGYSQQILVTGALDIASGSLRIGTGNASTTTFPEVHVYTGGWLRVQQSVGAYIAVSHPGWRYDGGGKFFLAGGAVTNNGYLHVAHGRGNDKNVYSRGELNISSGTWRNQGWTLIGGYPPPFDWPVSSASSPGWQYPPKLLGTFTLEDGEFRALADVHIARGPAASTVTLSGGQFIATNAAGTVLTSMGFAIRDSGTGDTNGEILPGQATLNVYGGTLIADLLVATNNPAVTGPRGTSVIDFKAGSLSAEALTLDMGIPLTVGDGVQSASLNLRGATHTVVGGVVVNTNATLTLGTDSAVIAATLDGALTLRPSTTLRLKVASNDSADSLHVTGDVALDGAIDVDLINGYDPRREQEWTVITTDGAMTGTIDVPLPHFFAAVQGGNRLVLFRPARGTMVILR